MTFATTEPSRCISSLLLAQVLAWRNPRGEEANWILRVEDGNRNISAVKLVVAECALIALVATAALETIAYTFFSLASLLAYPCTDIPLTTSFRFLQSSSFTIVWAAADALIYNIFFDNIMTAEWFARREVEDYCGIYRPIDRDYVESFINSSNSAHMTDHSRNEIALGSAFLIQDVLRGTTANTQTLFREMDPDVYMFVLTKAIYIYTLGSKRSEEVPLFFKRATRIAIQTLRTELRPTNEVQAALEPLMQDSVRFEAGLQETRALAAFNRLRNIASGELQRGLLITSCWQRACQTQGQNPG